MADGATLARQMPAICSTCASLSLLVAHLDGHEPVRPSADGPVARCRKTTALETLVIDMYRRDILARLAVRCQQRCVECPATACRRAEPRFVSLADAAVRAAVEAAR